MLRTLANYFLFETYFQAETMRNLSTRYSQLPVEQRAIYERKAQQLRSEYTELKDAYKLVLLLIFVHCHIRR